jgi:hypothetical protein
MLVVMTIKRGRFGGIGVALLVAIGCGDDGGDSVSDSNSASQSGTGTTGEPTEPTEGSGSMSMSDSESNEGGNSNSISGTTSDEGGNSDSMTNSGGSGNETISGSGTTGDETGMISGGGETTGTTGEESSSTTMPPMECPEVATEQNCEALGCLAIKGRQIKDNDAIVCIEDQAVFLGCVEPMICDDMISYQCKGDALYELPSSCAPPGFSVCEPPPDQGGNGYPPC